MFNRFGSPPVFSFRQFRLFSNYKYSLLANTAYNV